MRLALVERRGRQQERLVPQVERRGSGGRVLEVPEPLQQHLAPHDVTEVRQAHRIFALKRQRYFDLLMYVG